jgi:hypothetical protein
MSQFWSVPADASILGAILVPKIMARLMQGYPRLVAG